MKDKYIENKIVDLPYISPIESSISTPLRWDDIFVYRLDRENGSYIFRQLVEDDNGDEITIDLYNEGEKKTKNKSASEKNSSSEGENSIINPHNRKRRVKRIKRVPKLTQESRSQNNSKKFDNESSELSRDSVTSNGKHKVIRRVKRVANKELSKGGSERIPGRAKIQVKSKAKSGEVKRANKVTKIRTVESNKENSVENHTVKDIKIKVSPTNENQNKGINNNKTNDQLKLDLGKLASHKNNNKENQKPNLVNIHENKENIIIETNVVPVEIKEEKPKVVLENGDVLSDDGRLIFRVKDDTKILRSGTLEGILDYVVLCLGVNNLEIKEDLSYFLGAHQRVTTSLELFDVISKIYETKVLQETNEIYKEGIKKFISFWVENDYYPDFVSFMGSPNAIIPKVKKFIHHYEKQMDYEVLMRLDKNLPYLDFHKMNEPVQTSENETKKEKELSENIQKIKLKELSDEEIVEGLTRIDASYFRSIPREEFLCKNFEGLRDEKPNAAYVKFADRIQNLSQWISSLVLNEKNKKKRVLIYTRLVEIAILCEKSINISSLRAILVGLDAPSIRRLTQTLKDVSGETKEKLKGLHEDYMGFSDSIARNKIKECIEKKLPCIPNIDIIRTDLLKIDEGSKGDLTQEKTHIKFFKIVSFGKAIKFLENAFLPFPFEYKNNQRALIVDKYLRELPGSFEKSELLEASYKIESKTSAELEKEKRKAK